MNAVIGLKIEGGEEAIRTITVPLEVLEASKRDVVTAMQAGMLMIRDQARMNAAMGRGGYGDGVFTGTLVRSIDVGPIEDMDNGYKGVVGTNLPYGGHVEKGIHPGPWAKTGGWILGEIDVPSYTVKVKASRAPAPPGMTKSGKPRKGKITRARYERTIPERKAKVTVLDDWLRNSRKTGISGDSPQAIRERGSAAYLIMRKWQLEGRAGRWWMRDAVRETEEIAVALTSRLIRENMKTRMDNAMARRAGW